MRPLHLRSLISTPRMAAFVVPLVLGAAPPASSAPEHRLLPVGAKLASVMRATDPMHVARGGVASPRRLRLTGGAQPRSEGLAGLSAAKPSRSLTTAAPATGGPFVFEDKVGAAAFNELFCCTPPDSTGAIGPNHYVEAVNQLVTVYGRNLSQVGQMSLGSFTGASFGMVSDPQLEWDNQWGRWDYAATLVSLHNNFLLFGWSKAADPTDLAGGWCRFGVALGANLPDYPKLGHSDGFLAVGANVFDDTTGLFSPVTADIWAIPKPVSPSSCPAPTAFHFATQAQPLRNADGTLADTPVPANTTDSSAAEYVLAAHLPVGARSQSRVMQWHIAAGPSLVPDGDITVASYTAPAPAAQPGTTLTLDSLDGRLTQALAHFDPDAGAETIWTQHTVGGPSAGSIVDWYEFVPGKLTVRQAGAIAASGQWAFNAAITPSSAGNDALIEYNRSGPTQTPMVGAQSRRSVTALGTMDPGESLLGSSGQSDNDISCTPTCRWGDYSAATPDPMFPHAIWGSNQVFAVQAALLPDWVTVNFALFVIPT